LVLIFAVNLQTFMCLTRLRLVVVGGGCYVRQRQCGPMLNRLSKDVATNDILTTIKMKLQVRESCLNLSK